jgi:hypothetical protein
MTHRFLRYPKRSLLGLLSHESNFRDVLAILPEAKGGQPVMKITNSSDERDLFVGSISVVENHQSSWADYYYH